MIKRTLPDEWPDLQIDQRAWKKARSEFPNASLPDIAARAQQIKEGDTRGAESMSGGKKKPSFNKGD
jgi:hypothetical protein